MKKLAIALLFSLSSGSVLADNITNTQCLTKKYDAYIDASLMWYQDLVAITTMTHPDLKEVGDWFLAGRTHHFELNRAAVDYYLINDPSKVAIDQSVESWLKLEQSEIKTLSQRDDKLGQVAKTTFDDRQSPPNEKNYELRSAFADLLSHPSNIKPALDKYNQTVAKTSAMECP
ncbi:MULTISPECIES: hypothetical protein [Vibrio]|uniref:Uncharacterized protein n=1 Tax=Vibrio casei TaxID=673372 RepID=A0A368LMT1_9VIBR|nr:MULTISPECIES: hypothetical protein [Vibrio]RCS73115.1 hypothetical protein CIK83_05505 [Vibrio casei]SJN40902.1 hypothetical protein FM109_17610 [Vibrio casei]HBV75526.1 hypothetical protein [Vibrio sp.]